MVNPPPVSRNVGRAVVLGASAGATEALGVILPALPADFSLPLIMVIHVPKDVPNLLIDLFASRCRLPIEEVEDKVLAAPGRVYVAPSDYHVLVELDGRLSLSIQAPVNYSRPSIDVLFESAADAYGEQLVGVLLSGASEDGARGLEAIRARRGRALVQDPKTAQAVTMPLSAIRRGAVDEVLTLEAIAAYLTRLSAAAPSRAGAGRERADA